MTTRHAMRDFVCVSSSSMPREGVAVLPLRAFQRDLGLRTRRALRKQLELDVPRSCVWIDGTRTLSVDEVLASTRAPRLCTQAVLAPVVEWFLREDMLLHEVMGMRNPMVVHVRHGGDEVVIQKVLGVGGWEGGGNRTVRVTMAADVRNDVMVVEVEDASD